MSKPNNEYLELNKDGKLIMQKAQNRSISELHGAFSDMRSYKKLSNHLIELDINGKIEKVAIFRLVPEGNAGNFYRKRVQIARNDLTRIPDRIIIAYINDDLKIYLSTNSIESVIDLPQNITTLFRVDIRFLRNAFYKDLISTVVKSRKRTANILVSRNIEKIFLKNTEIIEMGVDEFSFEDNFDDLNVNDSYDETIQVIDDVNAAAIGRMAEIIVNREIVAKSGKIYNELKKYFSWREVEWMNKDKESFESFDFKLDKNTIEVKGSLGKGSFIYSRSENELREKEGVNYFLIKVNRIDLKEGTYQDFKVYNSQQLEKMKKTIMTMVVREEENE